MSGLRWADSSSDESEYEEDYPTTTQHAGLNDGFIGLNFNEAVEPDMEAMQPRVALGFSSDEDSSLADDDDSDVDNNEDENKKNDDLAKKKKEEEEAEKKSAQKPLTKKERQALKAKELGDLDHLLNEFGVASTASTTENNDTKNDKTIATNHDQNGKVDENATATTTTKKKKKRNKKKNNSEASNSNTPAAANTTTGSSNTGASSNPITTKVDVAAVLKAKAKPKGKSAAEKAAATAAKEAKEKAKNTAKKKKKKRDKYAHGAPSR